MGVGVGVGVGVGAGEVVEDRFAFRSARPPGCVGGSVRELPGAPAWRGAAPMGAVASWGRPDVATAQESANASRAREARMGTHAGSGGGGCV